MKCYILSGLLLAGLLTQSNAQNVAEQYRPQLHFTPKAHWMNDPNGMLYHNGTYHLFFQYYPKDKVWGPMHWGHATSKDLVSWKEQPIALYPDSLGYIFSGSAVADVKNTSGFGKNGKVPLVAIFTHHNPVLEKQKTGKHEYQSIAYSLDDGQTWTKYSGNPVLPNPGITDFRDPKVRWYEPQKKWIMTLATKDRITFYSSPDLKTWSRESDFGADAGAHGGVWECPDLLPFTHNGKQVWVLIVNINPGGPNKGSAGQYFVGDFDGKTFKPHSTETKWLDWGADNYAAVTFSNTGNRTILMGWMSNWQYAERVPTDPWRSANTIARELGLKTVGSETYLTSMPVKELEKQKQTGVQGTGQMNTLIDLAKSAKDFNGVFEVNISVPKDDFAVTLSNAAGNEVVLGYSKADNQFFIDRTKSGKVDFEKGFAAKHTAPRFSNSETINLKLIVDVASVEMFADDGLTVMTDIFFPDQPMSRVFVKGSKGTVRYAGIKGMIE